MNAPIAAIIAKKELEGIIAVRNPYFGTPAAVKIVLRRIGEKEVTPDDLAVKRIKAMAEAFLKGY